MQKLEGEISSYDLDIYKIVYICYVQTAILKCMWRKKQHCLWKSQVSYKLMAKSYLDETTCFSSMDESLETKPFIIVSEPHEKRVKGFPLDSLSIDIPSGKYYYDVGEKSLGGCDMDQGFTNFFKKFWWVCNKKI